MPTTNPIKSNVSIAIQDMNPQRSDWHRQPFEASSEDTQLDSHTNNDVNSKEKYKILPPKEFFFGLLCGGLLAGIAFATLLSIYLKDRSMQTTLVVTTGTATASATTVTILTTTTSMTLTTTVTTATTTTTTTTTTTATTTTTTTTITTTVTLVTTTSLTSTSTTSATTTTTTAPIPIAFWPLDNNALELYNGVDGTTVGGPPYNTSLLGYGAAISLTRSSVQYVAITSKPLPLDSRSFTIEAWIYPIGLTGGDYGIFGQCQATTTNLCLHFMTRNNALYCGFFLNDVAGVTTLTMNAWSLVACVYDNNTQTQQVWLNGVLDGSRSASPYQGLWGTTTIGATFNARSATSFNGYIDQVRFETRAKNATELLNDATLYVYYSFDGGSLIDNHINGINGTASGNVTSVTGRVNQAVQFSSGSFMYFTYPPFYFLGITNQSFSIALWANPSAYTTSTLVFVHRATQWCLSFITMQSTGNVSAHSWNSKHVLTSGPIIRLNTWTHIGYTYSYGNGLQLYINGTLYSKTGSFTFVAYGMPMHIIIGNDDGGGGKTCAPYYGGPFTGVLDEFYLYNREISAAEVWALANP